MSQFNPELHLVRNLDDIVEFTNWLGTKHENNALGLDTETTGLDWYHPNFRTRMVQVGDKNHGWAFEVEGYEAIVKEILSRWDGDWVIHNASYDTKVLKKTLGWEVPWHRIHDTMIMKQIYEPGSPAGLKDTASRFVSGVVKQGEKIMKEEFKKGGWDWSTVPFSLDSYWQYGALDPSMTVALYSHLKEYIDTVPEVYSLEMAVLRCCVDMEYKGMHIDSEYVEKVYKENKSRLHKIEKSIKDNWGFEPTKNGELIDFLKYYGAEFTVFTGKGAESVNKEQLDLFVESGNKSVQTIAKTILDYRNLKKVTDTYLKGYLTESPYDSRLYANINTLKARTGRMSSSNPNLQNLPSNGRLIKDAFIPDDPSKHYLKSCDYSSMELRMLTNLSKDPSLIEAYRRVDENGEDFFVNVGKILYNEPDFQKSDKRRKSIKGYMYGMMYGGGHEKLAKTAGVSLEEIEVLDEKFKSMYPGIVTFMDKTMKDGEETLEKTGVPFITYPSGRRIPADKDEKGNWKIYALTNYMLQGRSAEETKKAIVRLDAVGMDMRMVVHDEIIAHIDKKDEEEATKVLEEVMTVQKSEEYPVWIPAECDPGLARWGDKY